MKFTQKQKLAFLEQHGARAMGHGGRNLIMHLQGTEGLLLQWGACQDLCDAGLFHSVYGTESFGKNLIPSTLRTQVQEMIGQKAERLAWLFGMLTKGSFYAMLDQKEDYQIQNRYTDEQMKVTNSEYQDLCELSVANWLEQRPGVAEKYKYVRQDEFRKMRSFLSVQARLAIEEAYGF